MVENIFRDINEIIINDRMNDESEDRPTVVELIEETIIPKYGWENVQQALFDILLDDNRTKDDYIVVEQVFWGAALDKREIRKDKVVALLYYRLGNINAPYEENLLWSITAKLYGLDYVTSDYNALKDKKIINLLAEYGIQID